MTICPIALTAGCEKCPMFKVCPAKGLIGDYVEEEQASEEEESSSD